MTIYAELDPMYTPQTCFLETEGEPVGLLTCKLCGAAILLDRRDAVDAPEIHRQWHKAEAAK